MPRPLPTTTPPRLVELLDRERLPDLSSLAARAGLPARQVQDMVTRRTLRPLSIYRRLARALGVSLEDMYQILTADGAIRRSKLEALMLAHDPVIESQSHLARICDIDQSTISSIMSGKISCNPIKAYKALSNGLSINLDEFADIF